MASSFTREDLAALEPALLVQARRAVGDAELAGEIVQETLLAALDRHGSFGGRASLRTWVMAILTHKVVDAFRRRQRAARREEPVDDEELTAPASETSPEKTLARREAVTLLEQALAELPELERLAVLVVDVEGMDHGEAQRALGVTSGNLRVLLHRARHKLRKRVQHARL